MEDDYDPQEMAALSSGVLQDEELLRELQGMGWRDEPRAAPAAPSAAPRAAPAVPAAAAAAAAAAPRAAPAAPAAQKAAPASTAAGVLAMKKEALAMKKAGDKVGAMKLFKKAIELQKQVKQIDASASAAAQPSPPQQAADDESTALPTSEVAESLAKANEILKQTQVDLEDVQLDDGEEHNLEGELAEIMDVPVEPAATAPVSSSSSSSAAASGGASAAGGGGGGAVCPEAITAKKHEMLAAGSANNFSLVRKLRAEIKKMEAAMRAQPQDVTKAASAAFLPTAAEAPAAAAAAVSAVSAVSAVPGAPAAVQPATAPEPAAATAAAAARTAAPAAVVPTAVAKTVKQAFPPVQRSAAPAAPQPMPGPGKADWELQEAIASKRREAINHHKAGRTVEAKAALRAAKELEAKQNAAVGVYQPPPSQQSRPQPPQPQSPPQPPPQPRSPPQPQSLLNAANAAGWNEFEEALQAAIRDCASRVVDEAAGSSGAAAAAVVPPRVAELARKQNATYSALLNEAKKRRLIPGCVAPSFEMTRQLGPETEVVLSHLRSDELQVRVLGLGDMIDNEEQRILVEVELDQAFLKDDKTQAVQKSKSAKVARGVCTWGALGRDGKLLPKADNNGPPAVFSFQIKRSKALARNFNSKRKTLDFRLKVETKGFFKTSEEVIAEGKVPLSGLLTKCTVRDVAKVSLPKQQRKQRRGEVSLELSLHHPVGQDGDGKEVTREPITVLRVGAWDENSPNGASRATPAVRPATTLAATTGPAVGVGGGVGGGGGGGSDGSGGGLSPGQIAKLNEEFWQLRQLERISPTSGAHVISTAVIEYELKRPGITAQRKSELDNALAIITTNYDSGFLTPNQYIENLQNRIGRDEYLVRYLLKSQRRAEAQMVARRIKIMQQESVSMKARVASGELAEGVNEGSAAAAVDPPSPKGPAPATAAASADPVEQMKSAIAQKKDEMLAAGGAKNWALTRKLKVEVREMESKLAALLKK